MTAWNTREELVQRVVTLTREKVSRRAIARSLGISRNTVRQIVEQHDEQRRLGHSALPSPPLRAPRVSKLDPYKERVALLLDKYAGITAQRIFEILRDEGFDGGATAIRKHVRRVRPKPKPKPSLETPVYGPGKMAESDWSPYKLTFTGGSKQELQLFGYTLVHSARKFYRAFTSYDTHALMQGHVAAFQPSPAQSVIEVSIAHNRCSVNFVPRNPSRKRVGLPRPPCWLRRGAMQVGKWARPTLQGGCKWIGGDLSRDGIYGSDGR